MSTQVYLPSKPRYEILDGLRGVAAMIVVAFHLFETYSEGPMFQILNHGYLAVDFFFLLSGFVIGYAYDDRWDRMTVGSFVKRRLIRLHPMVIMGSIVGALLFYLGDCSSFPMIGQTPWWQVVLMMLLGFTMIPASPGMDIRGWQETYPLNGPAWSLMWEYVANLLYVLFIRRFSKTLLAVMVAFSALLTLNLALNLNLTGTLNPQSSTAYTVIGGWSLAPDQLLIGATRLLYPFFMGLLLSRMGKTVRLRGGFWWCSALTALLLVAPHVGGEAHRWADGVYNAVCILLLFPLIVTMGAGSEVSGKSAEVCKFLGLISYPLYITHYPLVYMQMAWAANHQDAPLSMHVFMGVCFFIVAIGLAYAGLKLYDLPVREWLKEKWLHKQPSRHS